MQLDVLLKLCGPKVEASTEAHFIPVSRTYEEVLLLNVDDADSRVTLTGPSGSFSEVLRTLAQSESLESSHAEWYIVDWDYGGPVLSRMYLSTE